MDASQALTRTIDIQQLTLADFVAIAKLQNKKPLAGWYDFLKLRGFEVGDLNWSFDEWREVSQLVEANPGWAYHQYIAQEHQKEILSK